MKQSIRRVEDQSRSCRLEIKRSGTDRTDTIRPTANRCSERSPETVNEFVYPGSVISNNRSRVAEVRCTLQTAEVQRIESTEYGKTSLDVF